MSTSTERADLIEMLAEQRDLFRITVRKIDDQQARKRTTASELTLGGLLKHVANCEKTWVATIVARDENAEMDMSALGDEYVLRDDETVEVLLAHWDSVIARTEALIKDIDSLDELIPMPTAPWAPEREWWSVRKILLHVFREIAHHSGHADIIRESLDGANTTFSRADVDDETAAQWAEGNWGDWQK